MAQSVAYWQNKILEQIAGDSNLSALNSTSKVALYRLFAYVVAVCINLFEQTIDIFKTEIETTASQSVPGSHLWLQAQIFKFQYSSTSPQVVQLVDFVPSYATIDETLRIITRCAVKTLPNKVVSVKVAKSDPPVALSSGELTALTSYLNDISFVGVQYSVVSLDADKLYLDADIYYNGQYSPVISTNVIAAIETYLSNLDFNGFVRVVDLVDAIQAVEGVKDVVINDLAMRADATAFVSKTYLVQSGDLQLNKLITSAGYVVEETTVGETFTDKLNFIVE